MSDHSSLFHMFAVSLTWLVASVNGTSCGFILTIWCNWLPSCHFSIMASCAQYTTKPSPEQLISAVHPFITMDFLTVSVITALLAHPVSSGGPCLGKFSVLSYSFMTARRLPQIFWPCFKFLHNLFADLLGEFLWLHDAVCSLVFLNKPMRLSQKSCICNVIKSHTGKFYLVIRSTLDHSAIIRQLLQAGEMHTEKRGWTLSHIPLFNFVKKKKNMLNFLSTSQDYGTLCCVFKKKFNKI